jgi:hypothetical protein
MRKIVSERDGYRMIQKGDAALSVFPIDCPLCKCVVIDEMDTLSISRSGCCFDCENEIADPNRTRWLEGWRPEAEKVNEIISKRLSSPHSRGYI